MTGEIQTGQTTGASPPIGAAPHLTTLTLRRFRSHTLFDRGFAPGLVAISGPNGVGKTNILEAIASLSPGRGLRGATAEEMAQRPGAVGWSVSAAVSGVAPEPIDVRVVYDAATGQRSAKLDGAATTQSALAARIRLMWLTPAMDRLWIESASGRRRFLDRLTLAFDAAHGRHAGLYEKAMRDRNRLLREPRPDGAWLSALEARMAEAGAAIVRARAAVVAALNQARAEPRAQAREGAFPAADLAIVGDGPEAAATPEAVAARLAEERRGDAAAGRTRFGPHRADLSATYAAKGQPAAQCSTGEQKALLISLILCATEALRAERGAPPILLLDEIAAHLDESRRTALFDALAAIGGQVWMTAADADAFAPVSGRADHLTLDPEAAAGANAVG